jgi:hypothetical protein
MDISRLPVTPSGRSANLTSTPSVASRNAETVATVRPAAANRRTEDVHERVVQGELLAHERGTYQSTQGFINERSADQAQPSERQAGGSYLARSAVSLYLNNARPEAAVDLTHGRSVNFFV